jgi:phage tail sheath protein FI
MAGYGHPGVYITETLLPEKTGTVDNTSVSAFVLAADRGPTVPTYVDNASDVTKYLGGFTGVDVSDRLLQAVRDAFGNGSRRVWFTRIAGNGAAKAALTLNLPPVGNVAGAAALIVSAGNPGAWGNQVYIEVGAGIASGYFNVTTRIVPVGSAITNNQIVDRLTNVTLNPLDARYINTVVNNLASPNPYISVATPTGYVYTPGDVIATSTVAGGSKLVGGLDGTRDGAALDAAARQAAVYALDVIVSPFVLNMPGVNDATTVSMLASYADSSLSRLDNGQPGRGDVFVIVDGDGGPGATATTTQAVSDKTATYVKSDSIGVFYPWLLVPDPVNGGFGAVKLVPPGPSVVGRFIATDTAKGPFKSPAGVSDGRINNVLSIDPAVNNGSGFRAADLDLLNNGNVNVIKPIPHIGPAVIFGSRTLRSDAVTRYISARRTLIYARSALVQASLFAPFENNDPMLWNRLANEADKICRQLFAQGGLKGTTKNQAYFITCDTTNNTATTVSAGEVHLRVGLSLQRPAEFVVIDIGQFTSGSSVVESYATTA